MNLAKLHRRVRWAEALGSRLKESAGRGFKVVDSMNNLVVRVRRHRKFELPAIEGEAELKVM